ncbi:auxin-responsive protein SAUR71-like [Diospyros lotus]|uniref:auxin-responsive protein SAUR71-like n=1 Tax=Diospyros lotus TaxID=55363 RepID=UPI00224F58B7|nr:auxin-responsive protein SAUR71-like [Diospyros lotus]XP_052183545.1 auxin-responsive protein SAUR71-like [Diospyros lotus]
MNDVKLKVIKKNVFLNIWLLCRSKPSSKRYLHVAPKGCFSVYVGKEKQRFVVKTEHANHPLFRMLLEDAATEYGHGCEGPLFLPCEVHLFYKVLAEIDSQEIMVPSCGFVYGKFRPFSPSRRQGGGDMAEGNYGSYDVLVPSPLLKMNHF